MANAKQQAKNRKRTNCALSMKKQRELFKKKKVVAPVVDTDVIMEAYDEQQQQKQNDEKTPVVTGQSVFKKEGNEGKQMPIVNKEKILRNSTLPLKAIRGMPDKPNKLCNVASTKPISKKLAKKIMKEQKRNQKAKELAENAMQ